MLNTKIKLHVFSQQVPSILPQEKLLGLDKHDAFKIHYTLDTILQSSGCVSDILYILTLEETLLKVLPHLLPQDTLLLSKASYLRSKIATQLLIQDNSSTLAIDIIKYFRFSLSEISLSVMIQFLGNVYTSTEDTIYDIVPLFQSRIDAFSKVMPPEEFHTFSSRLKETIQNSTIQHTTQNQLIEALELV